MLYQEIAPPEITFNEHLYIDGKKRRLKIFDGPNPPDSYDAGIIKLSARPESTLNWEEEIKAARVLLEKNKYIIWEMDLGLFEEGFSFDDGLAHNSRMVAITQFKEEVYPHFKSNTGGLIPFRGAPIQDADALSYHLTLYAHQLDDDLSIILLLDFSGLSPTKSAHLLHPKRFSHYLLGIKGSEIPFNAFGYGKEGKFGLIGDGDLGEIEEEKVGVLVPDGNFDDLLSEIDVPYRLLYEDFANTSWDGLDVIIAHAEFVNVKAKRVLQGFAAAGGDIVAFGGSIGLDGEILFQDFNAKTQRRKETQRGLDHQQEKVLYS